MRTWALAVGLAAASALRAATPGAPEVAPLSFPGAETTVYRTIGTAELRLHVFKPKDWTAADHRTGFVFFFGGGWQRGTTANSSSWAKWASGLGMVGVAPDYRTHDRFGTTPLECVADARAAYAWVLAHAKELAIDPARIVVGGGSAGGHLALWTGITHTPPGSDPAFVPSPKPAALILISAVSDTSPDKGYTPSRFGSDALALSPIDQLDAKMPPVLAFHGDADTTVPQRQSLALRDKLLASGNTCEFVSVPGGVHAFTGMPGWQEKTRNLIAGFLGKQGLVAAPAH